MTGESDVLFQDPEGKPIARKNQKYSETPPTRLLSMTLNLCYWLGDHDADKGHELHKGKKGGIGALDRIDKPTKAAWSRILNQVLTMLMPKLKRQPEPPGSHHVKLLPFPAYRLLSVLLSLMLL